MPRRHSMRRRTFLAFTRPTTNPTLDHEPRRVREIVPLLQHTTELARALQHAPVLVVHALDARHLEHLPVHVRTAAAAGHGVAGDDVVVDARVDEDAAARAALVEAVDAQVLHVDAADFDVEVGGKDRELDAAAPAVFALDPVAVGVGLSL